MKTSLYSIFLLALLLTGSCTSDADSEKPVLVLANTEWELLEATLIGRGTFEVPGSSTRVPVNIDGVGQDYDMSLTFSDGDQLVAATGRFVFDVSVSALGVPLQSERIPVQGVEIFSGNWELLGDELVITDNEEVVRLDIVDNSETMLKLNGAIDASDFESLQEEGLTVSESSIEIVLVK
ncbi:hypothetical protein [Cyclobacterium marinum]|uniref:hypothetical protein n=1 Tax=Cyclobacterium marinum TaxID=104 RepID=UPI0011EBE8E0|nr:hypothetical protein [Cyclobacterium marinum]MBI0399466.1 hypothetical protein [Cyclobacterium marinum]